MSISKISNSINFFAKKTSVILLFIITVLTLIGIVSRYIFNSPIIWLYETTMVLFSWTTFLGVSVAFKNNEHIFLDFIFYKLSEKAAIIVNIIIHSLILIFLFIVIKDGWTIVSDTISQKYNTINLSIGWFYASFPISALFSIIHLIDRLLSKNTILTGKE